MRSLYSEEIITVIMKKNPGKVNKSVHYNLHTIIGGDVFCCIAVRGS